MLKGHGDNAYQYNTEVIADFSSNVYFRGPAPKLIKHLSNHLENIGNYPEVAAESLSEIIADKYCLCSENILITNGATEAFYLLAQLFGNSVSDIFIPSFSEYEDACKLYHHNINFVNNSKLSADYFSKANLTWLCNPNNPDGKTLSKGELVKLITKHKDSYIVLDEAYADFSLEEISMLDKIPVFKNLIVVRSLTKKYAIPGLRLGFIAASKELISSLMQIKQPWSVNYLAIEAGKYLLKNGDSNFNAKELIQLSTTLQQELTKINGLKVIPSKTSFFLAKLTKPASKTVEYLIKEHGILIRNASNFRSLDDTYIRISARSKDDNQKLIKAFKTWMTQ